MGEQGHSVGPPIKPGFTLAKWFTPVEDPVREQQQQIIAAPEIGNPPKSFTHKDNCSDPNTACCLNKISVLPADLQVYEKLADYLLAKTVHQDLDASSGSPQQI